jgi:hypothetical protein
MARVAYGVVLLAALAGCDAIPSREVPSVAVSSSAFTDRSCREIALQRGADAAANNYDRDMQVRSVRDSYRTCLAIKELHGGRAP